MNNEHLIGKHAYAGSCAPGEAKAPRYARYETFSVGVFEYVRGARHSVKRGPTKVRVKGPYEQPELVYAKAKEIAQALDEGTYQGPKSVMVKG